VGGMVTATTRLYDELAHAAGLRAGAA
jgi:hypothetical protein